MPHEPGHEQEVQPTPSGGAVVTVDPVQAAASRAAIDTSELDNLVPGIKQKKMLSMHDSNMLPGEEFLKQLGEDCVEGFDADLGSRAEWSQHKAQELKLFMSFLPPKTWPFEHASNVNLPFITVAVIQFQARAFDAIISNRDVVKTFFTGEEDEERSVRVGKYMNWQLLYKMQDFEEGFDKTLIQMPIMGSVFRKTYWDPIINMVKTDWVSAADFVVDYNTVSLEECTRKTHVLYFTVNDLRKRVRDGIYMREDAWDMTPGSVIAPNREIKEASDEVLGLNNPYREHDKPRTILEQHREVDLDGDGIDEAYVVTVDYETKTVFRITPREVMSQEGKIETIEYFTHYPFLPNPEGFYALGYGTLLRGLNEGGNTILNEIIDAGSLANIQGGFISKRVGAKRGAIKFKPGEFKEIDALVDDLNKAIFTFDFKGPDATLYSTLGLLFEYSKMVSSVSETMTGQLPASDTPASTVMALIEEGRKVYSAIHKRTHRAFKKELQKIYRLNSIFLDEGEYFRVLGDNRLPEGNRTQIGASDFVGSIDVVPVSDPTIASRAEQIMKAQAWMSEVQTNPVTRGNQDAQRAAFNKFAIALDVPDIGTYLKPPGPPPNIPPEEENAMMLRDEQPSVLPEQIHLQHMQIHDELVNGPFAEQMTPVGKQIRDRHHQDHVAALYLAEKGAQSAGGAEGAIQ